MLLTTSLKQPRIDGLLADKRITWRSRLSLGIAAIFMITAAIVATAPGRASATTGPWLMFSWGSGTNSISRLAGGTQTNSWASGNVGAGAATGITADSQYVYWANGQRVFRQPITGVVGTSVSPLVNITGWNNAGVGAGTDGGGQRSIQFIAVDADHIYIVARRGYDGMAVLRADKSTGLQDTSWTWGPAGGREAGGISVQSGPNGRVFLQWGNRIGYATKTATSGAPSTSSYDWAIANIAVNNSGADPVPIVNDGTYLYWRGSIETVYRQLMSAGTGVYGESVSAAVPGGIRGLAINSDTGVIYASSATGSSNTYTVYSFAPDPSNLPVPASYATFTSATGSLNSMTAIPAPALAPTISVQPAPSAGVVGQSVSISVSASTSDGGALTYQWMKDGTNISGATTSTLTIPSVAMSDAGAYSVIVTNTLGVSTATITSSAAVLTVTQPAPTTTTTTLAPATTTTTTTVAPVVAANAPALVTAANQAQLEAAPGEAVAIINGKEVQVETVKVETTTATPDALKEVAKEIVNAIEEALPTGVKSGISVVNTAAGAELSGLMVNPDDPKEKLNVPVESVTLLKAGDSAILISALNQTNLPAEVATGGVLQVTRGGLVAATAYGLPGSETGEIVLMSTPRLLQTFTVGSNGSYKGQVPLPKDIAFGSHTVVMATKSAKVSLGIKLVRTRMQFRIKRKISTRIFLNRAGVVKAGGGKITVKGEGRCRANSKRVVMAAKPGGCYITVRQAAKGTNKAVYYRFTVSVVKKLPKKALTKK